MSSSPLETIVYASSAVRALDEPALRELLDVSRSRNAEVGVTGMLIHAHGGFLQQIEGERDALAPVWESIRADSRHTDIRLFSHRTVEARRFEGWWMGFVAPDPISLGGAVDGFKQSAAFPLVDPALVHNTGVAESLLDLYGQNP